MYVSINPPSNNLKFPAYKSREIGFRANPQSKEGGKEKNILPALLLSALATGIGILAYIKCKKSDATFKNNYIKSLEEVQINLKNIFGKDFTTEDANSFIQKYKELNKISDNKEYYNKLFEQLKKDFQVENKSLYLNLWHEPLKVDGGVFNGYTDALTRKISTVNFENRIKTFSNLFHEFKHVKQNELMYKTDSIRLVNIKVAELEKSNNSSWQNILNNCGGDKNKAREIVQKEVEQVYKEIWGHLKPISKTSEEYKLGLKYLENEANRIPTGEHYYEQVLEKEAQFVEKAAEKLFKLIEMLGK